MEATAIAPPRVVELILTGKPEKQIAREMGVRVPTVRTYLTRIFQRTGLPIG